MDQRPKLFTESRVHFVDILAGADYPANLAEELVLPGQQPHLLSSSTQGLLCRPDARDFMGVDADHESFGNVDNLLLEGGALHRHFARQGPAALAHQPAQKGPNVPCQRMERSLAVPLPEKLLGGGVEVGHVAVQIGLDDRVRVVFGERRQPLREPLLV